jgi:hypothetical protein
MPVRKKVKIKGKKGTVDGIVFKSMLELHCYNSLKMNGLQFDYESESITLLPGFIPIDGYYKSVPKTKSIVKAGGKRQLPITYKPDFVSHTHKFYIETKGFIPSQHTFHIRWKLFLKWLSDNNMLDYKVFIVRNQFQVEEAIKVITNGQ